MINERSLQVHQTSYDMLFPKTHPKTTETFCVTNHLSRESSWLAHTSKFIQHQTNPPPNPGTSHIIKRSLTQIHSNTFNKSSKNRSTDQKSDRFLQRNPAKLNPLPFSQDWMTVSWVHRGPSYGQLPAEVRQLNELARESDRFRPRGAERADGAWRWG